MRHLAAHMVIVLAALVASMAGSARADVLLDETKAVGLPSVAAPVKYSFTASASQALTLTLTDLNTPAAFSALQVAVTLGDALVGSVAVDATTHAATLSIPAAAGNYSVYIVGTPDSTQGIGSFGVCVAPAASVTSCVAAYSFSGNIQAPALASSAGTSTLNTNFTSTDAGTYTVTITDDAFPVALQSISAAIFQGSTPVMVGLPAGAPTSVTLLAGTNYQLLLAALADTTVPAGLYSVQVSDPSGKPIFARTLPVGTLGASSIATNTVAQGLNLTLTDYGYPAPLASVGVAVTQGSKLLAPLTAAGNLSNFMAAVGSIEIWQYAVAGAQPGVYGVDLSVNQSSSAPSLFSTTRVVNPAATTTTNSYAFVATLPSAGTYNLVVNDFQFPSTLKSLNATVAQNAAVLQQTSTGDFTAAQGVVVVLVQAQSAQATAPQSNNGIFGVTVQTSGASPQILLDQTQAVGGVFNSETVTVGVSGGYTATLGDLGFPVSFQNLAVVVSQGSQVLGKIYGGGSFPFTVTPGQYVLTFVATPDPTQNYGLYTVNVGSTAPTVSFSASSSSVVTGGAVTLTWSSKNATTCTASGGVAGWVGPQATTGTLSVSISATATLTLTCTGAGGSASQSVNVAATAAPAKSGGGGVVDPATLVMLAGVWVASRTRRRVTV